MLDDDLNALPDGLDSYPEAMCKASVVDTFVRQHLTALFRAGGSPGATLELLEANDTHALGRVAYS